MEQFEIGGRTFKLAGEGTARKDIFTMRQIAACGVNMVRQMEGESEESFTYRLYVTALQTGDIFLLLGSLLVPADLDVQKWTEKTARDTAEFLGGLMHAEDKAKLRILLAGSLMPFFASGRRSLTTSRISSTAAGSDQPLTKNAERLSTETGASLFARFRGGITRRRKGF
jgi:hypothetical protein